VTDTQTQNQEKEEHTNVKHMRREEKKSARKKYE
jgi:hypothetical protein